jgi:hypothetical protein
MTLTRSQLTNALLALTSQQVNDLLLFEHFKKWTCELFALAHAVNYSTAHRRLHKLMKAGALMVKVGNPLASGGRDPDIYFPTQSGARMITRLRDRQKNYFVAPDTFNPIDNVHDLAALEATIRSGCFDGARAFQERKFTCNRQAYSLIPDAEFISPDKHEMVFVEVEQTSRPDHIVGKYQRYVDFFNSLPKRPSPWLVVVFPDERTKKMLIDEHEKAATAAAGDGEYNFYFATLTEMRAKRVMIYEAQLARKDGGGWTRVAEGFLDCTYALIRRYA